MESKVRAIQQMTRPQTKKDIRTFLGLTGYYCRFIRNYATIAEPLTQLTRKNEPNTIQWTTATEDSFQRLKDALTSATVMRSPDHSKTFILQTDASGVGVLSQGEEDTPVAYFSQKLSDRERRYSVIEQECLAIVLGIKAFEVYLVGKPFILQTDHRALQWIQRCRYNNARLIRWSLMLQPYTFTVQHRKGIQNANADALSRLPPCFALKKGEGSVTDHAPQTSQIELADHFCAECDVTETTLDQQEMDQ